MGCANLSLSSTICTRQAFFKLKIIQQIILTLYVELHENSFWGSTWLSTRNQQAILLFFFFHPKSHVSSLSFTSSLVKIPTSTIKALLAQIPRSLAVTDPNQLACLLRIQNTSHYYEQSFKSLKNYTFKNRKLRSLSYFLFFYIILRRILPSNESFFYLAARVVFHDFWNDSGINTPMGIRRLISVYLYRLWALVHSNGADLIGERASGSHLCLVT